MSALLQIFDTHFGTDQPHVVEALVALATQQPPDVVVLSGDITQRARPAQFHTAKAFVDRLGAEVLTIPGNHDIALFDLWARLLSAASPRQLRVVMVHQPAAVTQARDRPNLLRATLPRRRPGRPPGPTW